MTEPRATPLSMRRSTMQGDVAVLEVAGDLVVTNGDALRQAVDVALRDRCRHVVVDFSELSHIDTPGLALLFRLHQRCVGRGRALTVAALPERFNGLVRHLRLDDKIDFVDGIEEAMMRHSS